jgi:hypothetical protein
MLSLPIPDDYSRITYADIASPLPEFANLGGIVEQLSKGRYRPGARAHLDPDINPDLIVRDAGWRPIFGQDTGFVTHLNKRGVGVGSLFLFFGLYQETAIAAGQIRYARGAPKLHVLWGWLCVGEIIELGIPPILEPAWATYHPHYYSKHDNNRLYVAADHLPGSDLPGAGVFGRYASERCLTVSGQKRNHKCSLWQLPAWFDPDRCTEPLSCHRKRWRWSVEKDRVLLQSVGRGQEFVFDTAIYPEAVDWAYALIDSLS